MAQQRYIHTFLLFLALLNCLATRFSLSITITRMVMMPHASESGIIDETTCPMPEERRNFNASPDVTVWSEIRTDQVQTDRFDWSQELQEIILGAFYWIYGFAQVPAAMLVQKVGGKIMLLISVLVPAVLSMLTPVAVGYGGANALIAIRVLMGLFGSPIYPALSALFASWFPLKERAFLCALVYCGSALGIMSSSFISGMLLHYIDGWHSVFYFFGTFSILWSVFFAIFAGDSPGSHRFISDAEKEYLQREVAEVSCTKVRPPTPWRAILTSSPVWALICAATLNDWGYFVLTTDLPKYMNDVLHFSIAENGVYSSVPWILRVLIATSFGRVSDWLISSNRLSITNTRKLMILCASVCSGSFIVAASYAGCDPLLVVIFFTIVTGGHGFSNTAILVNQLDLSPNYASIITSLYNGMGSVSGILAPYVIGVLTPNSHLLEWRRVFWITFVFHMTKATIYTIWGSGEVQPWDSPKKEKATAVEENVEKYVNKSNERF